MDTDVDMIDDGPTGIEMEINDPLSANSIHMLILGFDRVRNNRNIVYANTKTKKKQSDPFISKHHDSVIPNLKHIKENWKYLNSRLKIFCCHDTTDAIGHVIHTKLSKINSSKGYISLFHWAALYNKKIPMLLSKVFQDEEGNYVNISGLNDIELEFVKNVINGYRWQVSDEKILRKVIRKKVRASIGYSFSWHKYNIDEEDRYFADNFRINDLSLTGNPRYPKCRIHMINDMNKKTSHVKYYSGPTKTSILVKDWKHFLLMNKESSSSSSSAITTTTTTIPQKVSNEMNEKKERSDVVMKDNMKSVNSASKSVFDFNLKQIDPPNDYLVKWGKEKYPKVGFDVTNENQMTLMKEIFKENLGKMVERKNKRLPKTKSIYNCYKKHNHGEVMEQSNIKMIQDMMIHETGYKFFDFIANISTKNMAIGDGKRERPMNVNNCAKRRRVQTNTNNVSNEGRVDNEKEAEIEVAIMQRLLSNIGGKIIK